MSNTTNFAWPRPAVGDSGTGYATALLTTYQEIDTDLAVEHDYASGHEGHHKAVTYLSMTADAVTSVCKKGATTVYQFVPVDEDADGDFEPYVDTTNWNKQKSTSTGTINWYADFGVPAAAKAVQLTAVLIDTSVGTRTTQGSFIISAKVTTSSPALYVYTSSMSLPNGGWGDLHSVSGIVPIAADGTSYYQVAVSYTGATVGVYLYVTGYFI